MSSYVGKRITYRLAEGWELYGVITQASSDHGCVLIDWDWKEIHMPPVIAISNKQLTIHD